ncbi:MAG: DUF1059 domain-containing protein [Candidatus Acidiferrales bacterium]
MAKSLECNDVIPGCKYAVSATTDEDVLRQAAEHLRIEHNVRHITPEIGAMMRAAIHEEKASAA